MIKLAHKFLIAILISCFMVGCATQQNKDPLEGVNRVVYKFNDVLDKAALKPVAQGYQAITPTPIQKGISNFFKNIFDQLFINSLPAQAHARSNKLYHPHS